jgi:epoxyqueuosine reductase
LRSKVWSWAKEMGYEVAMGPMDVVDAVRADIETRRQNGEFEKTFYETTVAAISYIGEEERRKVRSIVMLAVPRPAHRLTFHLHGGPFEATVPPTYQGYRKVTESVVTQVRSGPLAGRHATTLLAPLKPVAARLGLVAYGRNNITYAPRFGSYHQLVGVATDADLTGDGSAPDAPAPDAPAPVREPAISPACEGCGACAAACPTGAIGEDRFLLHAERCLTFLNESESPWPNWLDPKAHNALVGCMVCQDVCPRNAGLLRFERIEPAFTLEETERILADRGRVARGPAAAAATGADPLWEAIKAKLEGMGFRAYDPNIGRNLRAIVAAAGRG